jgi:DNA-binding transcriptional LysR family regulator
MHFDFVDLTLIVNLADTKNLARAAERCHISPPAASNRVKNLEEQLGFKLLYRTSQGMTLTPAGEAFVHHARLVQERVEHLAGDMQEYGEGIKGHVRIWANTTAISEFLPVVLSSFLRDFPDINVDLREVLSGEILKGVAESATDIGIVAGNVHSNHLQMLPYQHSLPFGPSSRVLALPAMPWTTTPSADFSLRLDAVALSGVRRDIPR